MGIDEEMYYEFKSYFQIMHSVTFCRDLSIIYASKPRSLCIIMFYRSNHMRSKAKLIFNDKNYEPMRLSIKCCQVELNDSISGTLPDNMYLLTARGPYFQTERQIFSRLGPPCPVDNKHLMMT